MLIAGETVRLTVASDAETVTLEPPHRPFRPLPSSTAAVVDGQAHFDLEPEGVIKGMYHLTAHGPRDRRVIRLEAISRDEALRTTVTRDGQTAMMIHFSGQYDRDLVRVLVDGIEAARSYDGSKPPAGGKPYAIYRRYGISVGGLTGEPSPDGSHEIVVQNLRFHDFWPERTFEASYRVGDVGAPRLVSAGSIAFVSGAPTPMQRVP